MAYRELPASAGLSEVRTITNDNFNAIRGSEAGTSVSSNPVLGMLQFRTDLDSLRVYDTGAGAANSWASTPLSRRFRISHGDLTEAANGVAQTVTIATLPANSLVYLCRVKTSTVFSGGSISTLAVTIGDAGSTSRYRGSYDLLASVSATNLSTGVITSPYENAASFAVTATFTPDGGHNLAALTAGDLDIWLAVYTLPEI